MKSDKNTSKDTANSHSIDFLKTDKKARSKSLKDQKFRIPLISILFSAQSYHDINYHLRSKSYQFVTLIPLPNFHTG